MKLQFVPGKPVTTTNFKSVQPLGVGGQLVLEQWEALYQILKHEVSPQCAGLLLEPVVDRQRGEVDWYLPSDIQSTTMSVPSKDVLLQKAHQLIEQGRALAQTMIQSSDIVQRQNGTLLEQALSYPTEDYIIEAPYGPAIVAWGHQSNNIEDRNAVVSAKGDEQTRHSMSILPPPMLSNKERQLVSYWPWLLSLLLLLLLLFLPWWEGLIPIQYCRYYWLGPLILLLLLLPVFGLFARNRLISAKGK